MTKTRKKLFLTVLLAAALALLAASCGKDLPPQEPSEPQQPEKTVPAYLETKKEQAGRLKLKKLSDCPADFVLDLEEEGTLRVLQLTDTQMIDPNQVRPGSSAVSSRYEDRDACAYDIIRQVVEKTDPDLILVTGDYVYGDYDDNGTLFREQTDFFDSLGIYWAPIFGNHDNDSDSRFSAVVDPEYPDWYARKQCQYFEQSEYCLFRTRAKISGYSNYSIALTQNDTVIRSIYMLDTKGSRQTAQELTSAQLAWYRAGVSAVNAYAGKDVPSFVGIHVPLKAFVEAAALYGYTGGSVDITIPENDNGDFGRIVGGVGGIDADGTAFRTFKENGTDGIFAGHLHTINTSILYEGVRLTFGMKSSTFDKYDATMLGGTLIEISGSAFEVSLSYYEAPAAASDNGRE